MSHTIKLRPETHIYSTRFFDNQDKYFLQSGAGGGRVMVGQNAVNTSWLYNTACFARPWWLSELPFSLNQVVKLPVLQINSG